MITPELAEYQDEVFDFLEYIGYPEYVEDFEPADVAQSLFNCARIFYTWDISPRLAALIIFGMTWEKIKSGANIHYHYTIQ